jgi:DNA-binding LacI/PurR family transcriptional regulator
MATYKKKTIDEIALLAGVSKATVSRVMNGTAPVAKETKRRVEAAIKKSNYEPNVNARKLAGGSGGSIALVLEESTEEFFLNPFWKSVVEGFISQAANSHLHPVLFFHSKDSSDQELVSALIRGNYDAIAIFGWHRDIKILEKYIPEKMRIVFGGKQGESTRFSYVGVDNVKGGYLATKHLIEIGCKNIVTITGDLTVESSRERLEGYKRALTDSGIKIQKNFILEGNFTEKSAESAIKDFLRKSPKFDAIFAGNDLMARGVFNVLKDSGLEIPQDVKLIGFDGSEVAKSHQPPLSTVGQPSFELGVKVAEQLMAPLTEDLANIELSLELILRESSRSFK